MKRNIANDENFMDVAGRHLNKLGFLDNELVYTESGLKHRRFCEPYCAGDVKPQPIAGIRTRNVTDAAGSHLSAVKI